MHVLENKNISLKTVHAELGTRLVLRNLHADIKLKAGCGKSFQNDTSWASYKSLGFLL